MVRPCEPRALCYASYLAATSALLTLSAALSGCDTISELLREETSLLTSSEGDTRALQLRAGEGQQTISGVARGLHEAGNLGPGCHGFIALEPTLRFELEEALTFRLSLRSPIDTTLVIMGPGGPYCDDDTVGLDPAIEAHWEPGLYEVFVGSYQRRSEPFEYEFLIGPRTARSEEVEAQGDDNRSASDTARTGRTRRLSAARIRSRSPRVLLDEDAEAVDDVGALSELPPARSFETRGGGQHAAIDLGLHPECVGYYNASEATFVVERDSTEALRLSVNSDADSALVVLLPDGSVLCADDSEGFDPRVEVAADEALGVYRIWVGGYHRGTFDAAFTIERGVW